MRHYFLRNTRILNSKGSKKREVNNENNFVKTLVGKTG